MSYYTREPNFVKKIFAIRHKATGQFVSCNTHCAWHKAGSAKVSWALANVDYRDRKGAFDKQDEYEIVELITGEVQK